MRRICVFAGSSDGARPAYRQSAVGLGRILAARGLGLVYGGARVGLMGALADAALEAGGEVVGVIPGSLVDREVAHTGLTDLRVVASMHQRKAVMAELADGFIALPGGWGTWGELFEILTWGQLGLHRKPCGLLNVEGYFDPLLELMAHAVEEGFVRAEHGSTIPCETSPEALLASLARHVPPRVEKWIDRASS